MIHWIHDDRDTLYPYSDNDDQWLHFMVAYVTINNKHENDRIRRHLEGQVLNNKRIRLYQEH